MPGGLAVSVVIVGAMLAASTGIVGATVVTMGMISLPVMLKKGYDPALSTGIIAASGTLGQIIPPSVVLVLLGSVLNVSVGGLFAAAVLPGLSLVALYVLYVVAVAFLRPSLAPRVDEADLQEFRDEGFGWKIIEAFLLPFALILAVLGSIFAGVATPTEAAAVGAMGAILLALKKKKANWKILHEAAIETTHLTAMVFMILLGATTFSFVFREMGGDVYLVNLIKSSDLSPTAFLLLVMLVVFIAGFFIDFIEIIFIIVPVVAPVFKELDMNLLWIGILLCINLQSSFLTPPFGFSLFYLKGVAPPEVTTRHLYVGIVPFVIIQMVILMIWLFFPHLVIPD
jgi:tripartite ATP-independent transporter DctM subunit